MSVTVHPTTLGLSPNGITGEKLVEQMVSVALATSELQHGEEESPLLTHGDYMMYRKEEDFAVAKTDCERVPGDASTSFAAFMIFDGHNGAAAAEFAKENLLKIVMSCVPPGLSREEWLTFLPRAMVAGFVKTDKEWQLLGQTSGTTATLVIVDGWTVTVGCVGDSRCVLDAQGVATSLTIDHRLDGNEEELERVKASGGEIARIRVLGGVEVGPLRVWPGGLCLSRSIGDMDVGAYVVAVPHVKQIKLTPAGGRLIIASDGVWDAVSTKRAARCCRGVQNPETAAKYVVKEAIRSRGLRDDTTCLVVDIAPRGPEPFAPAMKKKLSFSKLIRCSSSNAVNLSDDLTHEEIHDENSAALSERLGPDASVHAGNGIFLCALCRCSLETEVGFSVHAGSYFSQVSAKAWEGPFLCTKCKTQQNAEKAAAQQLEEQGNGQQQNGEDEDSKERTTPQGSTESNGKQE